ncbi:MAG: RNA polymerase sigma factor [bacterium]
MSATDPNAKIIGRIGPYDPLASPVGPPNPEHQEYPDRADELEKERQIERQMLLSSSLNSENFMYFYDKYYDEIFSFLFHCAGDRDLTEEMTSRVFFQALTSIDRFRWRDMLLKSWFYRIALNEWRQRCRRRKVRRHVNSDLLEFQATPGPGPLEQTLANDLQSRLRSAIMELDPNPRAVIILYYWEDCSVDEIADILDKPTGTIQSLLKRNRDKLQRQLSQADDHDGLGVP